jgi:hypothetical protein
MEQSKDMTDKALKVLMVGWHGVMFRLYGLSFNIKKQIQLVLLYAFPHIDSKIPSCSDG